VDRRKVGKGVLGTQGRWRFPEREREGERKGASSTSSSKGSGLSNGKGTYSRGKGSDTVKSVTWDMPHHQSGGKSFGKGQTRGIGYGKGASSDRWSDRRTQNGTKDSQRPRSPPPGNQMRLCFIEQNQGSCTKADCKWHHVKPRQLRHGLTARPTASISTLNSKSIAKARKKWTAKQDARVAIHLLKSYPDVLSWKSDPRAVGASFLGRMTARVDRARGARGPLALRRGWRRRTLIEGKRATNNRKAILCTGRLQPTDQISGWAPEREQTAQNGKCKLLDVR